MIRLIIVGAESTGKTTLAKDYCKILRAQGNTSADWVPEVGREATLALWWRLQERARREGQRPPSLEELVWTTGMFQAIALSQQWREQRRYPATSHLISDTDAFATGIWHERYLGFRSAEVEAIGERQRNGLYVLTHPEDVPFVQDGLRDGESIRFWMTERFVDRLQQTGRRWRWLRGSRQDRVEQLLEWAKDQNILGVH